MSHNNNNKNIQIQALISFLTFITNAYCAQPTPTAPTYLLHSAVQSGVLQNIAQALQTNSADINALDQEKRTPLHLAVTNYKLLNVQKYAEIVDLLMQHNADVNQYCGEHDEPPLFSAIRHKYGAPYLALLKHGADVNARTRPYFYNPLLLAAHYCTYDAIEPLLQHKADINATDLAGNTPLILAAYFPTAGNFKTVQKLIGAGADLDQKNNDKVTALHIARDDAIRSILLQAQIKQRKIYIPSRDWYPPVQPQENYPLHKAIQTNSVNDVIDCIKALRHSHTRLNEKYGAFTPLAGAILHGNRAIIDCLLTQKIIDTRLYAERNANSPYAGLTLTL